MKGEAIGDKVSNRYQNDLIALAVIKSLCTHCITEAYLSDKFVRSLVS